MARTGQITLEQGVGQTSGKPYTGLRVKVGKWNTLHFPTQFERDYLVEYLKDNKTGTVTLSNRDQSIQLSAGDFQHVKHIDSVLEYRYIEKYLNGTDTPAPTMEDAKIDLTSDEPNDNGMFDN